MLALELEENTDKTLLNDIKRSKRPREMKVFLENSDCRLGSIHKKLLGRGPIRKRGCLKILWCKKGVSE